MEFKLACNLCKQIIKGDPFEHLKKNHKPIEFFTLYPDIEWDDFEVKEPEEGTELIPISKKQAKSIKKQLEVEE